MSKLKDDSIVRRYPVAVFFILAYIIGFGLSALILLTGSGIFGFIASSSSLWAALIVVGLTEGKEGLKKLFSGFKRWRCNPIWYIIALFVPFVFYLVPIGISMLLGNPFLAPSLEYWIMFLPMFLYMFIQAGLGEEIGWRGFATPKLSENNTVLVSSLIVGLVWAVWHIPLYFFPGFIQYETSVQFGFATSFIAYSIMVLAYAVIFTWVYNVSEGNLWIPVLMHTSINVFGWFLNFIGFLTAEGFVTMISYVIIWVVFAIIVTIVYGPKNLSKEDKN